MNIYSVVWSQNGVCRVHHHSYGRQCYPLQTIQSAWQWDPLHHRPPHDIFHQTKGKPWGIMGMNIYWYLIGWCSVWNVAYSTHYHNTLILYFVWASHINSNEQQEQVCIYRIRSHSLNNVYMSEVIILVGAWWNLPVIICFMIDLIMPWL